MSHFAGLMKHALPVLLLALVTAGSAVARQAVSPPELVSPEDGAEEGLLWGHVIPFLIWRSTSGNSVDELQVAVESTSFSQLVLHEFLVDNGDGDHCRGSDGTVCRHLEEVGSFEWRVRSLSATDTSAWSATRRLSVVMLVSSEDHQVPTNPTLDAYPNPAGQLQAIEVVSVREGDARLSVVDVLGREVALVFEGHLSVGESVHGWDTRDLAAGTYLLVLSTSRRRLVLPVTIR